MYPMNDVKAWYQALDDEARDLRERLGSTSWCLLSPWRMRFVRGAQQESFQILQRRLEQALLFRSDAQRCSLRGLA